MIEPFTVENELLTPTYVINLHTLCRLMLTLQQIETQEATDGQEVQRSVGPDVHRS